MRIDPAAISPDPLWYPFWVSYDALPTSAKHCDTDESRVMIQMGDVCATSKQEKAILLQDHSDTSGSCVVILSKSIAVKG